MVLYQNGNESAFKVLYSRHSAKIYGYLKKRMKKEELVKDAYQDVFIKIHTCKHLYNSSLPVLPWLFTITNSVMIDSFRKSNRSKTVDNFDLEKLPSNSELTLVGEAQLLSEQLPENQRTAVQMRYVDDSTFEEIAQKLQTTPTNVRQIISRGIKRLKQLIEDGGP